MSIWKTGAEMDHLRHHRNLANPARLLSFSKHCLNMAAHQAPGWVWGRQLRKKAEKPSLPQQQGDQSKEQDWREPTRNMAIAVM